ncbi:MAG: hypothetical protein HY962_03195 [Ignavibacteriae bacterium]|nr:hypothetical protein [Ignavibacteriota bacterium]
MTKFITAAIVVLLLASCGKEPAAKTDTPAGGTKPSSATPPPAAQDISNEALVKIDPEIQKYQDAVDKAKSVYDAKNNEKTRDALVEAYTAFGNYMVYDSPVTPRKGKYRRALVEYRRALALQPNNEKVKAEVNQIEMIYRDMGRPVPQDAL